MNIDYREAMAIGGTTDGQIAWDICLAFSVTDRGFFMRVLDTVRSMPVRPGLSAESDAYALLDRVRFWAGHYLATRCDTRFIAASVSGRLAATGDYSTWPSRIPLGR